MQKEDPMWRPDGWWCHRLQGKPGLVAGGCTGEIIHSVLDILGLKDLCDRQRQLLSGWKCRPKNKVKTEDGFGILCIPPSSRKYIRIRRQNLRII